MSVSADLRPGHGLALRGRGTCGSHRRRFLVGAGIALAVVVAAWLALLLLGGFGVSLGARAIHTVPHAGLDFAVAHSVARALSLPLFLSLHDDINYTATGRSAEMETE